MVIKYKQISRITKAPDQYIYFLYNKSFRITQTPTQVPNQYIWVFTRSSHPLIMPSSEPNTEEIHTTTYLEAKHNQYIRKTWCCVPRSLQIGKRKKQISTRDFDFTKTSVNIYACAFWYEGICACTVFCTMGVRTVLLQRTYDFQASIIPNCADEISANTSPLIVSLSELFFRRIFNFHNTPPNDLISSYIAKFFLKKWIETID